MVRALVWIVVAAGCASSDRAPGKAGSTGDPGPLPGPTVASPPAPDAAPAPPVTSPPDRAPTIELTFAGDVMFGRFHDKGFRPIRAEKLDPFREVAALLASDHAMVNLETPVMRKPPRKTSYGTRMRFVTSPERVATLLRHGVTMVTIANNHFWDMKAAGAIETAEVLAELGIQAIGAARHEDPLFRVETAEVNGWKVGFIAAAAVCNTNWEAAHPKLPYAEPEDFADQIVPVVKEARATHDLVIVTTHWGEEYKDAPAGWQVRAAHRFVDAGADAVIGHHAHVLQGIERYKDKLIAYSLGNFLFDNTSSNRKWGGVLRLTFTRSADAACLAAASFRPTITVPSPGHHVTVAKGKGFKAIALRLIATSKAKAITKTAWKIDGDKLTTETPACPSP